MAHDVRLIAIKDQGFVAGLKTLTCPCGWREQASRMAAPGLRDAHAAACAACQVDDPDAAPLLALQMAMGHHSSPGLARSLLRALRSQGYDITLTPKDGP